jgi:hypothetical protein
MTAANKPAGHDARVSARAHMIWEAEGCPDGKHLEHWHQTIGLFVGHSLLSSGGGNHAGRLRELSRPIRKGPVLLGERSSASVHLLFGGRRLRNSAADDPMSIAIEHVRWCRAQGHSFAQIIQSAGFVPSSQPDFDGATCVLAAASRSPP